MRTQGKPKRILTKEEETIILDKSISAALASIVLDMPRTEVIHYRNLYLYRDFRRKASDKYKDKVKERNKDNYGKPHSCYNYWTQEDLDYIMNSKETDEVIAIKLNRTIASVQMKRCRLLKQLKKEEEC